MKKAEFRIGHRMVGENHPPLVIAEIGINHDGRSDIANYMIDYAGEVGCECVKFQCHIPQAEMVENDVIPDNAKESIWKMMNRCALAYEKEVYLKQYTESYDMIYLSTPFSREAADRLNGMNVPAFKIGSGECTNYPLIEHICKFGKPVILSTGMADLAEIGRAVNIITSFNLPYALMHCTSEYPTPYEHVRLGVITRLRELFPDAVIGFSDHSMGINAALGAVALGASIIEKHFTYSKDLPGSDIPISIMPKELEALIIGCNQIHMSMQGDKHDVPPGEESVAAFAHACIVSIADIKEGDVFTENNIWVKRPGTGAFPANMYNELLGKKATNDIKKDSQLRLEDVLL